MADASTFVLTPKQEEALRLMAEPPAGPGAAHILLRGGARSGKTFLIIRAIVVRSLVAPGARHAILRARFNHLKHSVIFDTFPKVMALCFPGLPYHLNRTDWFVRFHNGSTIIFGGLDEHERTEKILGQEYVGCLLNESSQITYAARNKVVTRLAQNVLRMDGKGPLAVKEYADCNPPSIAHWTARLWLKHVEPTSGAALADPENYATLQMNPADNRANISSDYIKQLESLPEKDRRRFLHGEFLAQVDNALWTMDQLDTLRASRPLPDMTRVVVAVDPSGCQGPEDERSDEIGIVVVGKGRDGLAYVLDDLSGHYSPQGWARATLTAFDRHGADKIVAERNFGGAMVESTIRSERNTAPVKLITSSRGKTVRAEPVAALYEQRRVRHVGAYVDLEDQLCNFSTAGYQGAKSPDRADALVFALSELMLEKQGVALIAV